MKLVCISDTHNQHDKLVMPDGDVLVCSGDFTGQGHMEEIYAFAYWLSKQDYKHKIVIAGNHELTFQNSPVDAIGMLKSWCPGVIYLQDSSVEIDGIKFYGSPWQPHFCDWAFNVRTSAELAEIWAKIPEDTDVLITHGPPAGILDMVPEGYIGRRVGCRRLLERVYAVKPKAHIFGHIHYSYGEHLENGTWFVNAANCSEEYAIVNKPIVIEV